MKQIIERNYKSIQKRGKITHKTTHVDFLHKAKEELKELENEILKSQKDLDKIGDEMADNILVILNWAKHYNIDIEKYIKNKIVINETR